jgi:hypothetical protein
VTIEKRKKILQINDLAGDGNLADSDFLKNRDEKWIESARKERDRLRAWLLERGFIPRGK